MRQLPGSQRLGTGTHQGARVLLLFLAQAKGDFEIRAGLEGNLGVEQYPGARNVLQLTAMELRRRGPGGSQRLIFA